MIASILSPVERSGAIECINGTISGGSASDICGTDTTDVNVSIEGSWTISVSSSGTLGLDLTPNSSGTLSTTTDNLNVYTNTPNGYQLYLNSTSGSTDIYNNSDTQKELNHFTSTTGTKEDPVVLTNNTWGYSLAPSPTTFSKVELTNTSADSLISTGSKTTGAGDNIDVTYGFKADTKLTPGTYSTQVTYTAVADVPAYTLSSITPNELHFNDQTNKQITILTSTPATELGLGNITAKITDGTNTVNLTNCTEITEEVSGTSYRGATCTYNANLPVGKYNVELTSSWHNATYILPNSFTIYQSTMQNFTTTDCTNLAESTASIDHRTLLEDNRDGKFYNVSKLADGNCWMVSNLALDGGRTLHTSDSNVTQDRTLPANISNGTASEYDVAQIYSGNANSTTTDCGTNQYCVVSDAKYGNLYNWNAATATVGLTGWVGIANESVCPKGWKLPFVENNSEPSYVNLMSKYNLPTTNGSGDLFAQAVQTVQQLPFNFSLAGAYGNGSTGQTSSGGYWTNSPHPATSTTTYDFGFYVNSGSETFGPRFSDYRSTGLSVRCVFDS